MLEHESQHDHKSMGSSYGKLAIALVFGLMAMYVLSMAFVAHASQWHLNLSNLYVALTW